MKWSVRLELPAVAVAVWLNRGTPGAQLLGFCFCLCLHSRYELACPLYSNFGSTRLDRRPFFPHPFFSTQY